MAELAERLAIDREVEALFRRAKRFDVRLAEALDDVPVPEGLAGRIVERLRCIQGASEQSVTHEPAEHTVSVTRRPARTRHRRRALLVGGGMIAAAASLTAIVWVGVNASPSLTEDALLTAGRERFLADQRAFADGQGPRSQPLTRQSMPREMPPSSAVVRTRSMRCREAGHLLGRPAVAYDYPGRATPRATLYVVRAAAAEPLPMRPPADPPISTGGVSIAAWQQGELIYVLAVRGGASTYRRLIAPPRHPLT
jgi:hypothetical protein